MTIKRGETVLATIERVTDSGLIKNGGFEAGSRDGNSLTVRPPLLAPAVLWRCAFRAVGAHRDLSRQYAPGRQALDATRFTCRTSRQGSGSQPQMP
jgi:hypothetical protein